MTETHLLRVNHCGEVSPARPGIAPGPASSGCFVSVEGVPEGIPERDVIAVLESKVSDLDLKQMEYRVGWADLIP